MKIKQESRGSSHGLEDYLDNQVFWKVSLFNVKCFTCINICIFINICICMNICIYINICIFINICICINLYILKQKYRPIITKFPEFHISITFWSGIISR